MQDGGIRAQGRRPDLDQEGPGDRDPGGVTAGEPVESDVPERVHQQRGGGLGVAGGVEPATVAAEQQLVAEDVAPGVGDRLADDGDFGRRRAGGCGRDGPHSPIFGHQRLRLSRMSACIPPHR
jgi:hypothetical protein